MKILSPFNDLAYLDKLIEAGADEFYMGFYSYEWSRRFGYYSDINRLTLFKDTANKYALRDIEKIAKQIHKTGHPLFVTLNAPAYNSIEFTLILKYIQRLGSYGVDGIITSVPEMIAPIHENGMRAIASTMCGIQNSSLAAWYRDLGIDRIIFPREVTTQEMWSVTQNVPEPEYEAFLMRNGCRYQDSGCLGLHGGKCGALCSSIRNGKASFYARSENTDFKQRLKEAHQTFCTQFHEFTCGQCAIYRLWQSNVSVFKIVGRLDNPEEIIADIALTKKNIEIAGRCSNEAQYLEAMIPAGDAEKYCRGGLSCYYPEVRW